MKSSISGKTIPAGLEDGPEEGEIVSDDLEDISDDSISFTPCNGKSLSRSDHLNALSLSSITDLEEFPLEKRRKRKKCCSQRHAKRRKRSRRKLMESDSSDNDDTTLDRRLKLQLQAAVRVDVEEAHRNSLRTRLRAMVNPSGPESHSVTAEQEPKQHLGNLDNIVCLPVKDSIIEINSETDSVESIQEVIPTASEIVSVREGISTAPENLESSSDQSKDEVDSELIQLRIEALKTAINNKFANRKRRKKDNITSTPSDDTNKENTNNNNGDIQEKKTENKVESPQISPQSSNEPESGTPPSPEEDEDVLRALLLASMSKKITSIEPEVVKATTTVQAKAGVANFNKISLNKKTGNINNFKVNNLKKIVNNVKNVVNKASGNTKLIKMPQVKPLIINVNADSDSDFDLSPEKSPKKLQKSPENDYSKPKENKADKATIESSVDKFLREQRAKVESQVQKINKGNLESLTKIMEIKNDVKKQSTTVNSEVKLVSSIVTKISACSKNITSNTMSVTTNTNKTTTTKKNTQNSTPVNPKNLKLAGLEKSALKFLPENKREEYKQLQNMLKLRKAQLTKPRVRRASQKGIDSIKNSKNVVNKGELASDKNSLIIKSGLLIKNKVFPTKIADETLVTHSNNLPSAALVEPKQKQNNLKPLNLNSSSKTKLVNNSVNEKEYASKLLKIEVRNQERRNQQLRVETRNQERKSDALLLHTTLKQMQTRKDGRLQIQERYKNLRPLIKKINAVSKEQKHWDQEVKQLLEQLAEARKKQQEVHQNMSAFVKELAEKKHKMDDSLAKISSKPKLHNFITSTPLREKISEPTLDISVIDNAGPSITSNPIGDEQPLIENNERTLIDKNKNFVETDTFLQKNHTAKSKDILNDTWEQSTIVANNIAGGITNLKRALSDTELVVVDPNDIDNIIRKTEEQVAVLEKKGSFEWRSEKVRYVSPLDGVKRKEESDPFAILCPFEVNGMCKDAECTFRHLPK